MAEKRVVRRRRTAEEAREAILAAAERRFVDAGPDSLRLQEIAKDVGVAHPTVLHHFGSREELLAAVIERVQSGIYAEVFAALADADLGPDSLSTLLERVATVIAAHGHARVLYWLALSNTSGSERRPLGAVVNVAHERRTTQGATRGRSAASREDTRFMVMLATFALTAESVLGSELFGAADADTSRRFRAWLGALLSRHLES
jgi:AcrR family transcriptional regulator